jgi:hypothetical protein
VPSAEPPAEPDRAASAPDAPDRAAVVGAAAGPVAARWRRGVARSLDLAVVGALLFALSILQLLRFLQDRADRFDPPPWGDIFVLQVVAVALSAAVEVGFVVGNQGQTPGRDRMRIGVRVAADGSVPGPGRALARWAVPGLALLVPHVWPGLIVLAACGLPLLWGERSLPDLVAGTRVVPFDRGRAGGTHSGGRGGSGDLGAARWERPPL